MEGIKASLGELQKSKIMDALNAMSLGEAMSKYLSYQVVEIIIVAIVCAVQVQFIKKLFKSASIL